MIQRTGVKLEQHAEKDLESGKTVSKRQKEGTSKKARGYPWEMYWSVRSVVSTRTVNNALLCLPFVISIPCFHFKRTSRNARFISTDALYPSVRSCKTVDGGGELVCRLNLWKKGTL
jgi:hypothetical protein